MFGTIYNKHVNYFGQTFAYLKKHCLLPIAAMIVPSLVACFLSTPYWEVSFMTAFDYHPYQSGVATFRIMFGDSWRYVWPVLIIAAVQIFGAALIMSAMDKHFRTGKLSFRSPWRLINNTVFPIAIGVAIMSVLSIILRFLLYGLVMLIQVVGNSIGLPASVSLAIIAVLAVAMFILHVLIITPILFWAPIMFIYGYKFRDAAALSFRMLSGKKVFIGLFLPMLICAGIQLLIGFLQAHAAIVIIVNFIVFLFTNVYAAVYVMITFYEISGLERRDIAPYRAPLPLPPKKPEPEPEPAAAEQEIGTEAESAATSKTKKSSGKRSGKPTEKSQSAKRDKKPTAAQKPTAKKSDKQQKPAPRSKSKEQNKRSDKSDIEETTENAVNADQTGEGGGDVV